MKKKIISLFIAFILCFTFLFPFTLVSAASVEWLQPVSGFAKGTNITNSQYNIALTSLQSLFDRNNINYNSYYIIISDFSVTTGKHIFMFPKGNENLANYNFESSYGGSSYNVYTGDNIYIIADDFSGVSLYANNYQSTKYGLCKNNIGYYCCTFANKSITNVYASNSYIFFNTLNLNLAPEDAEPVYGPYAEFVNLPFFSLDVEQFYDWLVSTNKINQLPSYIGSQKLKSFLSFYKTYGSSNRTFTQKIRDWFNYMNIANQSKDNVDSLKRAIDTLYNEYINYISGSHAYWPGATKIQERQNIDTITDDTNTILITDDSSDTLDISILRDILRGVISISNNIIQGVSDIVSAINRLDFTVNVANDGGSSEVIWGSGDITQSSNYQALSDAFVEHGVVLSDVESLQYNYLAGQTQKDSFTVSVDMPDEYINGEFTKKTITHTVDSNSKMYDTLVLFRKIIALAVILFYVVRLKLALPSLIKGE